MEITNIECNEVVVESSALSDNEWKEMLSIVREMRAMLLEMRGELYEDQPEVPGPQLVS